MRYPPIENYGIVGDLHTAALVGMNGSIDMLCLPFFDSPAVFARLLDHDKGGHFQIHPEFNSNPAHQRQMYLPDTNVLLTRFLSDEGVAELSDFMPVHQGEKRHLLVRRVKTVRGEIPYRMHCAPRFNYARDGHTAGKCPGGVIFRSKGKGGMGLRLLSEAPLRVEGGDARAEFTLRAGESMAFVLEQSVEGEESPAIGGDFIPESFKQTVNYWRAWVRRSSYQGRWREMVNRSALTLKLLTSEKYGSIVASPTFGLPEKIGGERNWDYRYTWIRDASFTLYALIRLGYTDETAAFMRWIEERCSDLEPDGSLQVMYRLDGRKELPEEKLHHLEGYRGSRPVSIGNAAYRQLQLDIYGELMDSVYLYNKYGAPISHDLWNNLVRLIDWVCDNWQRPDEGIWEVRGGPREFLYSRFMCWVAMDRGLRLAMKRSFPAPVERWVAVRDRIYRDVFENFWDPGIKAFVQHKGGESLDASTLLMPLVKFISPSDPRWLSALGAIEKHLVDDSLVYRYRHTRDFSDGLPGSEGTFSMCTFWFVECLSRAGDLHRARFYFDKMLGYGNHLGLFAEELGEAGQHLGNFPQAFTHLALISAAFHLDRALSQARLG